MKNRMINCTVEAVENLYKKKDWCGVFNNIGHLRIPTQNPLSIESYVCDQPNSVWEIIDKSNIAIHSSDGFLDSIKENPHTLIDYPKDIFLIDRTTKSKVAKNNYGIVLMTERSAKSEILKLEWSEPLIFNQNYSWHRFFTDEGRDMAKIPSNSLIIIDRYLFTDFDLGIYNLCRILDEILPTKFNDDYHILIVSDPSEFKRYVNSPKNKKKNKALVDVKIAATEIFNAISTLRNQFRLQVELLALESFVGDRVTLSDKIHFDVYSDTHNRRIVSNTFIIRAEHKFCAIKKYKNTILQSNASQTIWFDANYAGVDKKYQNIHALPIKVAEGIIKTLSKIVDNHINIGRYFLNGQEGKSESIINRLLRN